MADDVDRAALREQEIRDDALRRRRGPPGQHGREWCLDCGSRIPEARRRAAPLACRCVDCQALAERRL